MSAITSLHAFCLCTSYLCLQSTAQYQQCTEQTYEHLATSQTRRSTTKAFLRQRGTFVVALDTLAPFLVLLALQVFLLALLLGHLVSACFAVNAFFLAQLLFLHSSVFVLVPVVILLSLGRPSILLDNVFIPVFSGLFFAIVGACLQTSIPSTHSSDVPLVLCQ